MRLLILLAALVPAGWGQSPATSIAEHYRRTHDALFAFFLPVAELKNDPKMTQLMNVRPKAYGQAQARRHNSEG